MASIDLYLRSMVRFGATGVILKSGANVTLRFPSGDRHATQTTPHGQLQEMVGAAAPDRVRSQIASGSTASFEHEFEGKTYEVKVAPMGSEWTVEIGPAEAKGSAMPEVESIPLDDSPIGSAAAPAATDLPGMHNPFAGATEPAPIPREPTGLSAARPVASAPSSPPVATAAAPAAPRRGGGAWIDQVLHQMMDLGASDLHLCTGSRPYIRESGHMTTLDNYEAFSAEALEKHLYEIAPEDNRADFEESHDTDFAYYVEGLSRFRVNLFRDRKGPGAVLRAIPFEIPTAEQLGLPEACLELCKLTKGLVLVTGPTGSGKSTTLAAMIDHINKTRSEHIITIEDPVEFVHENQMCLVNQREVHTHTMSFKNALRAALREDPDIVLVGEMRDLETIAIAVETAETGHLVFGTLHTSTAPSTVDRIIDQFPSDRQEQIRQMLSESLKGVIAQTLCRKKPKGRVAAHEILLGTPAVANLIREKKTFQLFSIMQTGRNQGMKTLNDSLLDLVKRGLVDPNEAYMKAVNKAEFKNLLGQAGLALG